MRSALTFCLLTTLSAGGLLAQEPHQGTVYGGVGIANALDDEGSIGSGFSGAGGLVFRVSKRFGVGGSLAGFRHGRDITPEILLRGDAFAATADGYVFFTKRESRAQAYLQGGGGVLRHRNRNQFPEDQSMTRRESTTGTFFIGGGFRIALSGHVSIGPEFRLYAAPGVSSISRLTAVTANLNLGYRW